MKDLVGSAVSEALRGRYGAGVVIESWGATRRRQWSWQTSIRVTGALEGLLIVKVPRWPEAPSLERAVAAGSQAATVAEYEALESMAAAVTSSRDPGLTSADPIAYVAEVNAIVMRQIEGWPLRRVLRGRSNASRSEALLERVGRLVAVIHSVQRSRRPADAAAIARRAADLSSRAESVGARELARLMSRLAEACGRFGGGDEPVGMVHGDLNASNVIVDRSDRVAVIDPNPRVGVPQLGDIAHFATEIRLDGRQLLSADLMGGGRRAHLVEVFTAASGADAESLLPIYRALALGERWDRLESETGGVRRLALPMARITLRRSLRSCVAEVV